MIKKLNETTVRCVEWGILGELEEFSDFEDLFIWLNEAKTKDELTIKLSSFGGRLDVGDVLIQAIRTTKAQVTIEVITHAYSMAAILALSGDKLIMTPNTFLMFHTYSSAETGKSHEMYCSLKYKDLIIKNKWSKIIRPFLTIKELERIHNGEDIYILAEDPSLPVV